MLRDTGTCSRCKKAPTQTLCWPWLCKACREADIAEIEARLRQMIETARRLNFGQTSRYDPGHVPLNLYDLPQPDMQFSTPFRDVPPIVLEHVKMPKQKK